MIGDGSPLIQTAVTGVSVALSVATSVTLDLYAQAAPVVKFLSLAVTPLETSMPFENRAIEFSMGLTQTTAPSALLPEIVALPLM